MMKEALIGKLIPPEEKTYDVPKLKTPVLVTVEIGWSDYKENEMNVKEKE